MAALRGRAVAAFTFASKAFHLLLTPRDAEYLVAPLGDGAVVLGMVREVTVE